MKKSTSLKKLSLKTETVNILTNLAGVRGGDAPSLPETSIFLTVGTGPIISNVNTCADSCKCLTTVYR